jgi:hypothetical protein
MYKTSVLLASVSRPFRMHSFASSVSNQAARCFFRIVNCYSTMASYLYQGQSHPAQQIAAPRMTCRPHADMGDPALGSYTFINEPYIRSMSSKSAQDLFLVRSAPYVIHAPVESTAFKLQCAIFRYRIYENRFSGQQEIELMQRGHGFSDYVTFEHVLPPPRYLNDLPTQERFRQCGD